MSEFEAFKKRVGVLPRRVQLAFSTACLERLLPALEHQTGESWGAPHNMVAMAWSAIDGEPICKTRWTRIGGMLSTDPNRQMERLYEQFHRYNWRNFSRYVRLPKND